MRGWSLSRCGLFARARRRDTRRRQTRAGRRVPPQRCFFFSEMIFEPGTSSSFSAFRAESYIINNRPIHRTPDLCIHVYIYIYAHSIQRAVYRSFARASDARKLNCVLQHQIPYVRGGGDCVKFKVFLRYFA